MAATLLPTAPQAGARSLGDLMALMERVMRRGHARDSRDMVLQLGDIEVDVAARSVRRGGREVALSTTEFNLLLALIWRRGTVVTRHELRRDLWGCDDSRLDGTLRTHLYRLRRKIGDDPFAPRYIHTVHKIGYRVDI